MAQQDDKEQKLKELGLPMPAQEAVSGDVEVSQEKTALKVPEEQKEAVASQALSEAIKTTEQEITPAYPEQEVRIETTQEQGVPQAPETTQEQPVPQEVPQVSAQVTPPIVIDEERKEIEKIMSEGLEDEFKQLTPQQQERFKKAGEKTATKIQKLFKKTKFNVHKAYKLLVAWLRKIPHVNKFFLQQEAKIKADALAELKKKQDEDLLNT